MDCHLATPHVEAARHRSEGGHLRNEGRALDSSSTEDHAADARREQHFGVLDAANTTTHLDGNVEGIDDGGNDGSIHRVAAPRSIQVNHVHPRRPRLLEGEGLRHRVVPIDGLPPIVTPEETDAEAAAQVDGRKEGGAAGHAGSRSTKFWSTRSPGPPDFSGWNCVAQSVPEATAAHTVLPYSQVATVSGPTGAA